MQINISIVFSSCIRHCTEGRTHMVAWGEMGEERHGMGHHYGETAAPCAQGATARWEADGWLHRPASQPRSTRTWWWRHHRPPPYLHGVIVNKERKALAWTSSVHQRSYVQGESFLSFYLGLFVLVLKLLTLKPHYFKDTTEIFTLQIKQNIPFSFEEIFVVVYSWWLVVLIPWCYMFLPKIIGSKPKEDIHTRK
jgi:hypothetical protein